ncbi:hypothetical protein COW46_02950 [Candidatus Gracilibacteria bacterium CG17_big_fil_post_rev_8_21_14_2_50_48_13]|nr:MAG: hypothetical protein COW46_02950 [Candidatus Gracilibacteria bacterium CG17_big_fil_post_rev_8_21_14_2_50_48_13]
MAIDVEVHAPESWKKFSPLERQIFAFCTKEILPPDFELRGSESLISRFHRAGIKPEVSWEKKWEECSQRHIESIVYLFGSDAIRQCFDLADTTLLHPMLLEMMERRARANTVLIKDIAAVPRKTELLRSLTKNDKASPVAIQPVNFLARLSGFKLTSEEKIIYDKVASLFLPGFILPGKKELAQRYPEVLAELQESNIVMSAGSLQKRIEYFEKLAQFPGLRLSEQRKLCRKNGPFQKLLHAKITTPESFAALCQTGIEEETPVIEPADTQNPDELAQLRKLFAQLNQCIGTLVEEKETLATHFREFQDAAKQEEEKAARELKIVKKMLSQSREQVEQLQEILDAEREASQTQILSLEKEVQHWKEETQAAEELLFNTEERKETKILSSSEDSERILEQLRHVAPRVIQMILP